MSTILPLNVGDKSTATALAADLGKQWEVEGVTYILLQAAAALTAPAGLFVLWHTTANKTGALAGAAAVRSTVAALVPSTVAGNIAIGDYFLGIRGGWATATYANATAANAYVAVHAAGVDDATVTQPTTVGQSQVAVGATGNARLRVILDAA
jgi:hypothetical protein